MQTNYLKFFVLMIILNGCDPLPKTSSDVFMNVELERQNGYNGFEPQRKVLFPLKAQAARKMEDSIEVNPNFEEYVIRIYALDRSLALYKKRQKGRIPDERWEILKKAYNINPRELVDIRPSYQIYIAYGELKDGERALQVDTDLDGKLEDEQLMGIDHPLAFVDDADKEFYLKNKHEYLPQVELNIQYTYEEENLDQKFKLMIDPYNVDDLISYVQGQAKERSYYLSVSIPQYYMDTLQLKNREYRIALSGNFKEPMIRQEHAVVHIKETRKSDSIAEVDRYAIGDSLYLDGIAWQIRTITPDGKLLKFKKLPEDTKIRRLEESYYFPKLLRQNMNTVEIDPNKPQSIWVWDTRTINPSFIDRMSEWQEEHPDRQLISLAYDKNRGAVRRMVDRLGLEQPTFYTDPEKPSSSNALQDKKMPLRIQLDKEKKVLFVKNIKNAKPDQLK